MASDPRDRQEEMVDIEGFPLVEEPKERTVTITTTGIRWGDIPPDPSDPTFTPGRAAKLFLTPEEFRAGYRLAGSLGPPISFELSEAMASRVDDFISTIDQEAPRTAALLANRPHMMFLVPEISQAVDDLFTSISGDNAHMAGLNILNAINDPDIKVFSSQDMETILSGTEVTAMFWSRWGDFFDGADRDIVATLLALVPADERDNVAARAMAYLDARSDEMAGNPEAVGEFIFWMYNEAKTGQNASRWEATLLGKVGKTLEAPYRFVRGLSTRLINTIVSPDQVAWRNALTPGQTLALALGLDPSDETAFSNTSGAIDFVGAIFLDPINWAGSFLAGAKAAKTLPLTARAAEMGAAELLAKSALPFVGKRVTRLPRFSRWTWSRVGYALFAKNVDELLETPQARRAIEGIAKMVADGAAESEIVSRYPQLRSLIGEGGGGLNLVLHRDPALVKEGLRMVMKGWAELPESELMRARQRFAVALANHQASLAEAAEDGTVRAGDLIPFLDVNSDLAPYVLDLPGTTGEMVMRRVTDPEKLEGRGVAVWVEPPTTLDMSDPEDLRRAVEYMAEVMPPDPDVDALVNKRLDEFWEEVSKQFAAKKKKGQKITDEDIRNAHLRARVIAQKAMKEAGGIPSEVPGQLRFQWILEPVNPTVEKEVPEQIASVFDEISSRFGDPDFKLADEAKTPDEMFHVKERETTVSEKRRLAKEANKYRQQEVKAPEEAPKPTFRVVRIPWSKMNEDLFTDLRAAISRRFREVGIEPDEADALALDVIEAGLRSGRMAEDVARQANEKVGLPLLYVSDDLAGDQGAVPRISLKGTEYRGGEAVAAAQAGITPLDVTEPKGGLIPGGIHASTVPYFSRRVGDTGQIAPAEHPLELVVWSGRGQPKLIDLNAANEDLRKILDEEFQRFIQRQGSLWAGVDADDPSTWPEGASAWEVEEVRRLITNGIARAFGEGDPAKAALHPADLERVIDERVDRWLRQALDEIHIDRFEEFTDRYAQALEAWERMNPDLTLDDITRNRIYHRIRAEMAWENVEANLRDDWIARNRDFLIGLGVESSSPSYELDAKKAWEMRAFDDTWQQVVDRYRMLYYRTSLDPDYPTPYASIDRMHESAEEFWQDLYSVDDVVFDPKSTLPTMAMPEDVERFSRNLKRALEGDPFISDWELLTEFRNMLERAGLPGRDINATIARVWKRLQAEGGYDGVRYVEPSSVIGVEARQAVRRQMEPEFEKLRSTFEAKEAALQKQRDRVLEEVRKLFGEKFGTLITDEDLKTGSGFPKVLEKFIEKLAIDDLKGRLGKLLRRLNKINKDLSELSIEYQQSLRKLEDDILKGYAGSELRVNYTFFEKSRRARGYTKKYFTVKTGVKRGEKYLEFRVPGNMSAREYLAEKMEGVAGEFLGEVFLRIPKKKRRELLRRIGQSRLKAQQAIAARRSIATELDRELERIAGLPAKKRAAAYERLGRQVLPERMKGLAVADTVEDLPRLRPSQLTTPDDAPLSLDDLGAEEYLSAGGRMGVEPSAEQEFLTRLADIPDAYTEDEIIDSLLRFHLRRLSGGWLPPETMEDAVRIALELGAKDSPEIESIAKAALRLASDNIPPGQLRLIDPDEVAPAFERATRAAPLPPPPSDEFVQPVLPGMEEPLRPTKTRLFDLRKFPKARTVGVMDPEQQRLFAHLADRFGADRVALPNGVDMITDRGKNKLRFFEGGKTETKNPKVSSTRKELVRTEMAMRTLAATDSGKMWFLRELPRKDSDLFSALARAFPWSDRESWSANFRRRLRAALTTPTYAEEVSLVDTAAGYTQLENILRHMGVRRSKLYEYLDRYLDAPVSSRYDVLTEIFKEVADEIDHPGLRYGIINTTQSAGLQPFTPVVVDGKPTQLTLAKSRTREGAVVSRPAIPSHTTETFPAPPRAAYAMLTKYRLGKRLPKMVVRGVLGGTKSRRAQLAQEIANKLAAKGVKVTPEEAALIAFSHVLDPDSMGALAKGMRMFAGPWRWVHRAFTRVQLAARPITWAMRVVFYDEQARAALLDTPSMHRNPLEWWKRMADAWRISRMSMYQQALEDAINQVVGPAFREVKTVEAALSVAEGLIPGFKAIAKRMGMKKFASVSEVKGMVRKIVRLDSQLELKADLTSFGSRFLSAQQRVKRGARTLSEYGLPRDFVWGDLDEITQKGLTNALMREVESTFDVVEWVPGQVSPAKRAIYGRAYGKVLHQQVSDPWARIALRALARQQEGVKPDGSQLLNSRSWVRMKEPVKDVLEYRGLKFSDEAEAAQLYLENVLIPWVKYTWEPLFESADEMAQGILRLLDSGSVELRVGVSRAALNYVRENPGRFIDEITRIVDKNPNHAFPPRISAQFDVAAIFASEGNPAIRFADSVIQTFGEDLSQALNRRPAYLDIFKREFEYLRDRGVSEELAREIARGEAARRVNQVYFNMKDVPHLISELNRVIPFFSALYEVSTTWAYKIPMMYSVYGTGWTGGAALLARKVDRILSAMTDMGLVRVDRKEDPKSPVGTRSLTLVLSHNLPTNDSAGRMISGALRSMAAWPVLFVQNMIDAVRAQAELEEMDRSLLDSLDFEISVGNPLDPWSHGLGSALQLSAGLNPIGSALLSQIRSKSFWAGDERKVDVRAGMTLADVARLEDRSVQELVILNRSRLENLLGGQAVSRVMRGLSDGSDAVFEDDTWLTVPKSTLIGELLDNVFFPFDQKEYGFGVLSDFAPSWLRFFVRGFGVYSASGEDAPYEVLENGEVVFVNQRDDTIGDLSVGFVNAFLPVESRVFMAGEILLALQHLESTEGVLSEYMEMQTRLQTLIDQAREDGIVVTVSDDGDIDIVNIDHPRARAVEAQILDLRSRLRNEAGLIIQRATHIAATLGMARGMAGLLGPANPRMVFREAARRQIYYNSRDAVEDARITGSELFGVELPEVSGVTDVRAFFELANLFMADDTPDSAQRYLREKMPEVLPFLKGRTYWGAGGEPIRVTNYEQYVDQIRQGLRKPMSPEVQIILQLKQAADITREVKIIEAYGNDPFEAFAAILENPQPYREITDEYQAELDLHRVLDAQFGYQYKEFVEELEGDFDLLVDDPLEVLSDINRVSDILSSISSAGVLANMDNDQLEDLVQQLEFAASSISESRKSLEEKYGDRLRNPRESLIAQYYDEVIRPDLEKRTEIIRRALSARNTEERSAAWSELRRWENAKAGEDVLMRDPNSLRVIRVPNVVERRWNYMTPEERRREIMQGIIRRPEWVPLFTHQKMVEEFPALAEFVPVDPESHRLYDRFDEGRIDLQRRLEIGEITRSEYSRLVDQLEEDFFNALRARGREGEVEFYTTTPAKRLVLSGAVTNPAFSNYVAIIEDLFDQADQLGIPRTGADMMRAYKESIYPDFLDRYYGDPGFKALIDQLAADLGEQPLFLDRIFPMLFLGKFGGEF